jgi:hypothetical protein
VVRRSGQTRAQESVTSRACDPSMMSGRSGGTGLRRDKPGPLPPVPSIYHT